MLHIQFLFGFRLTDFVFLTQWVKSNIKIWSSFQITKQQMLPEAQNFTYFCFRPSDKASPDCSRKLLGYVWRWEKFLWLYQPRANFAFLSNFSATFRFKADIKYDKVNVFLKKIRPIQFRTCSPAYCPILERVIDKDGKIAVFVNSFSMNRYGWLERR